MEPGGSMQHSQGLSNNPYAETNQSSLFLQPISLNFILKIYSSHSLKQLAVIYFTGQISEM